MLELTEWPYSTTGQLTDNTAFIVEYDRIGFTLRGLVEVSKEATADNGNVTDLMDDVRAAFDATTWEVVQTDLEGVTPDLGTTFEGMSSVHDAHRDPSVTTADIDLTLREGRLAFVTPYAQRVKAL